jgi:hypothetical protein
MHSNYIIHFNTRRSASDFGTDMRDRGFRTTPPALFDGFYEVHVNTDIEPREYPQRHLNNYKLLDTISADYGGTVVGGGTFFHEEEAP